MIDIPTGTYLVSIHTEDEHVCVTHYIVRSGAGRYVQRYKKRGGMARAAKRVQWWIKHHGSVFVDVEQITALMAESLREHLASVAEKLGGGK